ncbi:MAG: prolyl-tRNA synthetase associated domain-containing protein [Oscillospiraceae bacterium]|nr:prolyl-tRNA synthetase associated domain-containing protein [Oscillospiraceae bacterium]
MNKQEVYSYLREHGVEFDVSEHEAVFNMEELAALGLPHTEAIAKNLFVRDDKKRNYYLITVRGDKHVNLKEFQQKYGTRKLSFGSAEDLSALLGLTAGEVTPFGLLNDAGHRVQLCLDADFMRTPETLIGVHPNDNTATVRLRTSDLVRLLTERGCDVRTVEL